jgi:hypothetical protein
MKTLAIDAGPMGSTVSVELTEFELTALVALVEEGRERLTRGDKRSSLHQRFEYIADEFSQLLAHFELLSANDEPL